MTRDARLGEDSMLRRAADRMAPMEPDVGIVVRLREGRLALVLDIPGRGRRAARRAERIFDAVWYDAFGQREPHVARLVERPDEPPRASVTTLIVPAARLGRVPLP